MKRLLIIVVLTISNYAFSQISESQQVNKLHRNKFEWLVNKNYDSLNWILDAEVKYIHSNGWIQSKKEVIEDIKSGKLNYTSVEVQESSVSMFNKNCAVVTGKGIFKGLMPDKSEFNINLLYTEVYVKQKKNWKLVSRQACKL
jgi:hypothetical protein